MTSDRIVLALSGVMGFLGVALGAFGAHGLRARLAGLEDFTRRMEWWDTAARYHLIHAVMLAVVAWTCTRSEGVAPKVAAGAFVVGTLLFSGSLYTMTLTGIRALGAVTPLGGVAFLVGWASLVWIALRG